MREQIKIGDKIVTRGFIIGTNTCKYEVWEPMNESFPNYSHSSMIHIDGDLYGELSTRVLPAEIAAMPKRSEERYNAAKAYQTGQYEQSYKLILEAYPHLSTLEHFPSLGDITTYCEINPRRKR